MNFKNYKKKDLIQLINELYIEIENNYKIIEEKDEMIEKLFDETKSESSIENEEIKPLLSKREERLKKYLEKKMKVILIDEQKEIYKNYYERLFG